MIGQAAGQRRDGQRAVDRGGAGHHGAAGDVEIGMVVRAAGGVDHRVGRIVAHDGGAHDVVVGREIVLEFDLGAAEQRGDARVVAARVGGAAAHVVVDGIVDFRLRYADRVLVFAARQDAVGRVGQDRKSV